MIKSKIKAYNEFLLCNNTEIINLHEYFLSIWMTEPTHNGICHNHNIKDSRIIQMLKTSFLNVHLVCTSRH